MYYSFRMLAIVSNTFKHIEIRLPENMRRSNVVFSKFLRQKSPLGAEKGYSINPQKNR
jgi:hypothetical protein